MLHGANLAIAGLFLSTVLSGQTSNRLDQSPQVVSRTTPAVNYRNRGGATKIDFRGTALLPAAKGSATVESVRGHIHISVEIKNLERPFIFGPEYLTYVLWAILPDGRPVNLGELMLIDKGKSNSKLSATTDLQTFGMIVTAEPYFAVTQPSDIVIAENAMRRDTTKVADAKYELLARGTYTSQGCARQATCFVPIRLGRKEPLELYEAENAVQLSRVAGADKYASDSYLIANEALQHALHDQAQKPGQKSVITMARDACLRAEDARMVAIRARLDEARAASLEQENAAKAIAAAREADEERAAVELARREAEEARQGAIALQQILASEAEKAQRVKAEQGQARLRRELLQEFNAVLETTETPRGLIVNMSDVLFDPGSHTLKPAAREKLAKVAGIILGHPGLKIEVDGYTDGTGSAENRADVVRDFLIEQGVRPEKKSAEGLRKANPLDRVELVVSGEILGTQMSTAG